MNRDGIWLQKHEVMCVSQKLRERGLGVMRGIRVCKPASPATTCHQCSSGASSVSLSMNCPALVCASSGVHHQGLSLSIPFSSPPLMIYGHRTEIEVNVSQLCQNR